MAAKKHTAITSTLRIMRFSDIEAPHKRVLYRWVDTLSQGRWLVRTSQWSMGSWPTLAKSSVNACYRLH